MKTIKALLLLCIVIALQATANASSPFMKRVKPSGEVVTKTFDIPSSSYERMSVSSTAKVKIVEGSGDIEVKIDSNLLPYLVVKVSGGELKIELDRVTRQKGEFTFDVIVPSSGELNEVSASGVSRIDSEVLLTGDDIKISVSGVSHVEVDCKSETMEIYVSGVSSLVANIESEKCKVRVSGTSTLTLEGEANHADLKASGVSNISATALKYKTIDVSKSGVSNVDYRKN